MRLHLSTDERNRGRRGVLCARLAMAEAEGGIGTPRADRLRAELVEFDQAARYRFVNSGRLPYPPDVDVEDTGEAAG